MSTFIIRNKKSLIQWVASSGKNSWKKSNHAKSAFANSRGKTLYDPLLRDFVKGLSKYESLKFNNQNIYEVVEVYSLQEKHSDFVERKFNIIKSKLENSSYLFSFDGYPEGVEHQACIELLSQLQSIVCEEK